MSLIFALLNLQRAGLIDPIGAALDEPLVPRRFRQSTPLQHSQEPCEWRTRWQMSSPSSRRPIPHGGLSRGYPIVFSWAHWHFGRGLLLRQPTVLTLWLYLGSRQFRPVEVLLVFCPLRFAETDARPAAVLVDKFDAMGFECAFKGRKSR